MGIKKRRNEKHTKNRTLIKSQLDACLLPNTVVVNQGWEEKVLKNGALVNFFSLFRWALSLFALPSLSRTTPNSGTQCWPVITSFSKPAVSFFSPSFFPSQRVSIFYIFKIFRPAKYQFPCQSNTCNYYWLGFFVWRCLLVRHKGQFLNTQLVNHQPCHLGTF